MRSFSLFAVALLPFSTLSSAQRLDHGSFQPQPGAVDMNPHTATVEVDITASVAEVELIDGELTEVYAYNGTVPGPTIQARVGQTLVVNFTNELPVPTTIHWHGVELPANMDGSNIAQEEVPPGGTFRYEFKLLTPATYWYHPHVDGNEQVERGLYGALIVYGPDDRRVRIPRWREHVLFLDDVLLDEDQQIAEFATDLTNGMDPVARAEELFNSRQGNHILVSGKELPTLRVRNDRPIRLRLINPSNGRFMRLSAPGHTMYQIGGDGGLLDEMRLIEPIETLVDDTGAEYSDPDPSKGLLLTPSERADVVLIPKGHWGDEAFIEWHDLPSGLHSTFANPDGTIGFMHAHHDGRRPKQDIIRLEFGIPFGPHWHPRLPLRRHPIKPIPVPDDVERLPIIFGHAPPANDGSVIFFAAVKLEENLLAAIDGLQALAEDEDTLGPIPGMAGPPPFMPQPFAVLAAEDALQATVGETRLWHVVNFTGGDHTFHPHGFFFQPLEMIQVNLDGETAEERVVRTPLELETKDSVRIPRRPGAGGRSWTIFQAVVRFDDSGNPEHLRRLDEELVAFGKVPETLDPDDPAEGTSGGWLAHCHFLEHADRGMTNFLNLVLR